MELHAGTIFSAICLIASAVAFAFSLLCFIHFNETPASRPMGVLFMGAAIFAFSYGFEIMGSTPDWYYFWLRLEYIGLAFLPSRWLWVCIVFTNPDKLKKSIIHWGLVIISLVFLLIVWTNPLHQLYYTAIGVQDYGFFQTVILDKGPLYFVYVAWVVFSFVISMILYGIHFQKSRSIFKAQSLIMFIAAGLAAITFGSYQFGFIPYGFDSTPIMIILYFGLFLFGITRAGLMDVSPIAREKVFESTHEGVIVTDSDGYIVDFNPIAQQFLPALTRNLIGKPITDLIANAEDYTGIFIPLETLPFIVESEAGPQYFEIRRTTINTNSGNKIGTTWFLKNITEQHQMMHQLKKYAEKDALTNIWNSRKWLELAESELVRCRRYQHPFSLMLIDLDHFKNVNDTLGHYAGDQVLRQFANLITQEIRENDLFGRIGGEEFGLVFLELSQTKSLEVAERILHKIRSNKFVIDGKTIQISFSAGLAVCEGKSIQNLKELMKLADQALYRAKEAGRGKIWVADE